MSTEFTPRFATLVDILSSSRERFGDRPLVGTKRDGEWHWQTYAEFGRLVDEMRSGLTRLGLGRGDRLALISDNRWEWAVAAYAAYGLGASVVPMYEAQRDEDWLYILADSSSRVLIVATEEIGERVESFRGELPDLDHVVVIDGTSRSGQVFDELLQSGSAHMVPPVDVDPGEIAGFVYTSGTTGRPKGVLLSHENLASNVSAVGEVFPVEPDERTLSFLPWAHSFGQTVELHNGLAQGCSTAIAEGRDKIVDNMIEIAPTMLISVPAVFNRIHGGILKRMEDEGGLRKALFDAAVANSLKRNRSDRPTPWLAAKHRLYDRLVLEKVRQAFGGRLRFAISGGAAMSVEVAEFIEALGVPVYEGYGLSETSPIVTASTPEHRKLGAVGKPIPGVRVELRPVDTDDPSSGEIVVHGHCVMQGYHRLPEENARVFTEDGGLRTGDIGHIDEDGFLHVTGRVKEQYKLENGKYVVPTPLEEQLKLSPFILNAMVYGDNRPYNVALVVPDRDALDAWAANRGVDTGDPLLASRDVREKLRAEIDAHTDVKGYERIRGFVLVEEDFTPENGLLTPTLKVKRREVLERYEDEIEALYG